MKRDYYIDIVKYILMILVVFGHFLEITFGYGTKDKVYLFIYLFHMPVFVFITGYFAKINNIYKLTAIYLIFQTLYIVFLNYVLGVKTSFQYLTPYWLLWYLLTYISYLTLIPLIRLKSSSKKNNCIKIAIVSIITILLYLFVPMIEYIGYGFSLSRTISFLPYFIFGYYSHYILNNFKINIQTKVNVFLKIIPIILVTIVLLTYDNLVLSNKVLYGSYNYLNGEYGLNERIYLLFVGFSFIPLILYTLRINIKIPVFSQLAKNTLWVYLLHGFIVKYILYNYPINCKSYPYYKLLLFSIIIVIILSIVGIVFQFLYSIKYVNKIKLLYMNKIKVKI